MSDHRSIAQEFARKIADADDEYRRLAERRDGELAAIPLVHEQIASIVTAATQAIAALEAELAEVRRRVESGGA